MRLEIGVKRKADIYDARAQTPRQRAGPRIQRTLDGGNQIARRCHTDLRNWFHIKFTMTDIKTNASDGFSVYRVP